MSMKHSSESSRLHDSTDEKRRLLNALESARESSADIPRATIADSSKGCDGDFSTTGDDADIKEELRVAKGTCALLEEEVKELEKRALTAIAEAGSLRRKLDQAQAAKELEDRPEVTLHSDLAMQRTALRKQLTEAEDIKNMLTMALCESESEISRMVKSLEVAIRKLQAV